MSYQYKQGGTMTSIWALMAVNLLIFVASLFLHNLKYAFALPSSLPDFLERPWTLITSMFTHADLGHIFVNMLTLYFFGRFLIVLVNASNMLLIYFVGGIVGNLFFMLIGPSNSFALGASGAVFALGGALMAIMPKLKVIAFPIPIPMPLWAAILIGFVFMLVPGVAWQAHLGGLIAGLIFGWLYRKKARIPTFY